MVYTFLDKVMRGRGSLGRGQGTKDRYYRVGNSWINILGPTSMRLMCKKERSIQKLIFPTPSLAGGRTIIKH